MRREGAVADRQLLEADPVRQRVKEPDAATEEIGREVDQDLVAESGGNRLLAGGGTSELDVLAVRHRPRLADGAFDAVGDEREIRRPARVVGRRIVREDEDRHAIHRMPAAPAAGDLVGPSPEDERAALGEHASDLVEVGARLGPEDRIPVLLVAREVPVEEVLATMATQRVGYAVIRTGDEPVERHRHVDDDLGHADLLAPRSRYCRWRGGPVTSRSTDRRRSPGPRRPRRAGARPGPRRPPPTVPEPGGRRREPRTPRSCRRRADSSVGTSPPPSRRARASRRPRGGLGPTAGCPAP